MARKAPTIMIVDDDADFLELTRHVLAAEGYKVLCFAGPAEALEKMQLEKPDVVVTDLMMSALDSGFSFCRQVKEDARFADVAVVIVTAISSQRGFSFKPRTPEELTAMCADAYFEKPVSPKALLTKIRELLDRSGKEPTK